MTGDDKDFFARFETNFTQTRDDVNTLKQNYSFLQRDIASIVQEIKSLGSRLEERSKANWPAIGLAISMFTISIPGLGSSWRAIPRTRSRRWRARPRSTARASSV